MRELSYSLYRLLNYHTWLFIQFFLSRNALGKHGHQCEFTSFLDDVAVNQCKENHNSRRLTSFSRPMHLSYFFLLCLHNFGHSFPAIPRRMYMHTRFFVMSVILSFGGISRAPADLTESITMVMENVCHWIEGLPGKMA